ncbi:DUF2786 domain-containing protein [Kibdelosporangium philippinense]|uniref:DUF2786 domain-containing protein n=1 Tax=Kibdelosporangium philippinense TaxID=211113 RepID=A0ABS8ZMB0_9PSEU|nr:DUF2786 domain-containing protein [Kibdelosporangium philippinense]MCE7008855.1 DUF2786 domain-containing protein [Kibdelosporangium philippinense]
MGKRNREKRAAKKRNRPRPDATKPGHEPDDFWVPPTNLSAGLLANTLLAAAREHSMGDTNTAAACAAELSSSRFARDQRTVATGAGIALNMVLTSLWETGWLPADAWEITRRNSDAASVSLLVDVIAEDIDQYNSSTVDDRWAAQVQRLGATVWWNRDSPHLPQWAERAGVHFELALRVTITLMAALMPLPELPRIVPPPGTASRRSAASVSGVDQKILARVRALLAKAESTQFPEEAEALSAKAQELMNRHAFERALLDADTQRQQAATSTRLWLDNPYVEAKSSLVATIAEANRCKSVFYAKLGFVALVGEEMDLEITELLATSLLVQATRAMVAEGSHTTRSGMSRTRSFRRSFLISYAVRIGERLKEAGARAHDPSEDARLLPVLANRSRVVEETFRSMFRHAVQKSTSVTNGAGWDAGRAAADRANLTIDRQAVNS